MVRKSIKLSNRCVNDSLTSGQLKSGKKMCLWVWSCRNGLSTGTSATIWDFISKRLSCNFRLLNVNTYMGSASHILTRHRRRKRRQQMPTHKSLRLFATIAFVCSSTTIVVPLTHFNFIHPLHTLEQRMIM